MNEVELDGKVEELVIASRQSSGSKSELAELITDLFPRRVLGKPDFQLLISYIIGKMVDEHYCEESLTSSYEDEEIVYIARTIPKPKDRNRSFYTSGDSHFFYKLRDQEYILGRMDGADHGVPAALLVLCARFYLERFIRQGIHDTKRLSDMLNQQYYNLFRDPSRFTNLFISLLNNKRVQITNVGDGETQIFYQSTGSFEIVEQHGFCIGMFSPVEIKQYQEPYLMRELDISSGFTLVSYSDGISQKQYFDSTQIQKIMRNNGGNIIRIIEQIIQYSDSIHKPEDDATVLGLYIK